jgi:hypothetical protein
MKFRISACIAIAILFSHAVVSMAQTNTLYFMNKIPGRTAENPGFIPCQDFYISLPSVYAGMGNNSFAMNDLLKSVNGSTVSAFDKGADYQSFLRTLKPSTEIKSEAKLNILNFGFRKNKNYFSLGLAERVVSSASVPKDMFRLLLEGVDQNSTSQHFNLSSLAIDATAYVETSFGYARQVTPRLSVGGKLKLLFGQLNNKMSFSQLSLNGTEAQTTMTGAGTMRLSIPGKIYADKEGYPDFANMHGDDFGPTKFKGTGLGIDAGAAYKLTKDLTISASITDLGFIHWQKSDWEGSVKANTTFNNMSFAVNGDNEFGAVLDTLKQSLHFKPNGKAYNSSLTAHVRVGAEYSILKDKIGFGLLYDSRFASSATSGTITASANLRPLSWINLSVGYSLINNEGSNIGAGLNIIAGPFNWYVITDYLPLSYAEGGIPKLKQCNVQTGLSFAFSSPKKKVHKEKVEQTPPPPTPGN